MGIILTLIYLLHSTSVSYTHLRAHETDSYLVCRLLLEKKVKNLRRSINSEKLRENINDIQINTIKETELIKCRIELISHWKTLYGSVPNDHVVCLLYTSPSPRDGLLSRMPSSA